MARALAVLVLLFTAAAQAGTVTLVIDDLGYNREQARRALALPPPVTAAILPNAPYTGQIAAAANRAGIGLIVHMPMQGHEHTPHPGLLRADMDEAAFRRHVRAGIAEIPGAIGLNNHMGSVLTTDPAAMNVLMGELRASPVPLLFLDSRTTAESVAYTAATRAGIATVERDVFLDHDLDSVAIERQFERWLALARATGCALAIGHPHPETLAVLERLLPHMRGVRRVGLAEYVQQCGRPAASPAPPQMAAGPTESPPGAGRD